MNTQPPTNARREAVRKSGSLARILLRPDNVTAPVPALEQDPCGFGVSRSACHVGCGRRCRNPAR